MSSKRKTSGCEHSSEIIAIALTLKSLNKSYDEIASHLKLAKFTIVSIIHRHEKQSNSLLRPSKRAGRPLTLNARARRRLICHVKSNPRDNFAALVTLFKTGTTSHRVTIRRYLKIAGYLRYKARRKLFLSFKHKQARLK